MFTNCSPIQFWSKKSSKMLTHLLKQIRNFHPSRNCRFLTTGDRIVPSENFISWNSKDPVKIHFRSEKPPDNYPPILVETMFRQTVERHPGQLAIVANRSGMNWNLKWTFERLISKYNCFFNCYIELLLLKG